MEHLVTVQPQSIQYIPLNHLVASTRNVRRKDRKADIDALAASIALRGLLQNLCVVAGDGEKFEVDAGGRRLLALKQLARTGVIAKDFAVPCNVVSREDGREVSLTENIHRVAMDAMDEVDAYAALVADGATPDAVAHRFGVTRRHVDQRLALAGLSPKIKAAWKRGDVTLDAARAFCLVDDHKQQDAVFRSLGRRITHAGSVRARLMDGRMRASDRLATFVGLEPYEAAGGKVVRDLFDVDAVFIADPALLTKLAEDKLEGLGALWLARGWNWVEFSLTGNRGEGLSSIRLYPEWRDPTPDEQVELDRLSAEIESLDAALEQDSIDDDPRWSMRDDLEAAYETVRQAGRCWSEEAKGLGGVMLSIDHDGDVCITEGLVRSVDQKRVDTYLKQRKSGADGESEAADDGDRASASRTSPLPKAVNRDLTLVRTRAIRLALSGDADTALALCVAAMAHRSLHASELTGVAVAAHRREVDDLPELDEARAELEGRLPAEEVQILEWAFDLSRDRLLAVLAVLVAGAIDLAHEDASPADLRKQAVADRLAQRLDVDMTKSWTAGLDFWIRLPKSALLAALSQAPSMAGRGERARTEALKAHAKLRKEDLAGKVNAMLEGTSYLPDILVTPLPAGALTVTAEGAAMMMAPTVAAE